MANPILKIAKIFQEAVLDKAFHLYLGKKARDIVRNRTRAGKGVTSDTSNSPKQQRLKRLSKKYKKYRKEVKLGPFGKPGRSNLTLTGQMLKSMTYRATSRGFKVIIPDTRRRSVLGRADTNTNADIERYVRKERPFFALSVAEQRIIRKEVRKHFNKKFDITINEEI